MASYLGKDEILKHPMTGTLKREILTLPETLKQETLKQEILKTSAASAPEMALGKFPFIPLALAAGAFFFINR